MSLTLVVSEKNAHILVVSGKKVNYIGGEWEECPLHFFQVESMPPTLVVSGKNLPYVGGQWEECPLHL